MLSFKEYILQAVANHSAIGHFNISTLDGVWAVVDTAKDLGVPVIIGVSEAERDYVGVSEIVAVIRTIRESRKQPVFLNADHTYSLERVKEVIDAGFDSVIFDGAKLSLEENIKITKQCVEYARQVEQKTGRSVLVEGEIGFIGSSSKVLDVIPEGVAVGESMMTKVGEASQFVKETGVDLLAPAVGNIHGLVRGGDPDLNIGRIKEIGESSGVPLVLHGASGNTPDDIKSSIKAGVAIVHVNTELRLAYRNGLVKALSENPDEIAPYKYLKPAKIAMQKVVEDKLRLLS